jgi:hypothetical protein
MATATLRRAPAAPAARVSTLTPSRALSLPLSFIAALDAMAALPGIQHNPRLLWSVLGAAGVLSLGLLMLRARSGARNFAIDVQLRPQHYLQAMAQGTVLLYWGYYWRPVYDALPLIAAQLLFAYAFDILLAWSRRDTYTLGFAPFPVIFSTNLFLWFKPDWFYLQFLMIAVGFAAKELIRWDKDGRRAHIFNPSSFPLAVFSLALIATGSTDMTWGPEIARTQFNPPNIYLVLFLVGLPGQLLFGVTTMTMSAVVTTYLFGLIYFKMTGSYFFIDSYIPIAVFLGMHLLFTDPSTSPRTELGRILFGVLYGLGNVALYAFLGTIGAPTFYDKLLPVPILNLSIKLIDRAVNSTWLKRLDPGRLATELRGRSRNLAWVSVWAAVFVMLSVVDGVGDHHPGHQVPFWQQACQKNATNACENLSLILDTYCADGSGWACNEVGALRWHSRVANQAPLGENFSSACSLGFAVGCTNVLTIQTGLGMIRQAPPQLRDYPVVLRTGKGALEDTSPLALYTSACDQRWAGGCESLGAMYLKGEGVQRDPLRAASAFEQACDDGLPTACSNLGLMHYSADGLPKDQPKGITYLKRACDLGYVKACQWLKEAVPGG